MSIYVWISARAFPRGSPPPTPILFFRGKRENLEVIPAKTQYQSLNPAAVNRYDSGFWLRSATSHTLPRAFAADGKLVKRTQGVREIGKK